VRPRGVATLGLVLTACFPPGVYVCEGEGSCDAGVCEPNGFCSYPDTDCDSGRRYSARAGDGLAQQCVPAIDPTTTTAVDATSSSSDASSSEDTSAPPPDLPTVCGDDRLDPSEACDDGNLEPGDGCSPDCILSGTPIWEHTHADPFGGNDAAWDVAVIAPDDLVVAGRVEVGVDEYVAFYARHRSSDGEEIWRERYDSAQPSDNAVGIVVNGSNDVIVGGTSGIYPDATSSWLRLVDPDGVEVWTVVPDIVAISGLAPNGGGAVVVGRGIVVPDPETLGPVVLSVRETDGSPLWRNEHPEGNSFTAVARVADNDNFLALSIDGDLALVRGGAASLTEIDRFVGPFGGEDRPQAVAVHGGAEAIALAGYINTAAGPDWWLRVYDSTLAERWTRTDTELPLAFSDEIEDVAFGPDGSVHALGLVTNIDKDIFVAKFAPDGELVWSRTLPDADANVGDDVGRGLTVALDGSLVAVGERSLAGDRDAWIAKLVP
jgi:cysteine-rich repeat protein